MADVPEVQNDNGKKTYDSYIKEFMDYCSSKNAIRFINGLYGTSLPLDSKVVKLETGTTIHGKRRRSDFMIKIGERVFHIEVESRYKANEVGEMIFRMFDYGYRNACSSRESTEENSLTMTFPAPLIIYLRSTEKTPTEFTINLEFPCNKRISYEVPVKKLADYTPDALIDGNLYALALFYPMKYEATLRKEHTSEDEIAFLSDITAIIDRVVAANKSGEINDGEFDLILGGFEDILDRLISKAKILDMKDIRTQYAFKQLNWMAEGKEEEKLEIARDMKRDNLPFDMIQKYTKLPAERIHAL
jgi:hypothetical protein